MTRVRLSPSAPSLRRCSQDSKASACRADHRECNSPHRLTIVAKKFCAGVAQWGEVGPRKSLTGVQIAPPAPLVEVNGKSRRRVSTRTQFESACHVQKFAAVA